MSKNMSLIMTILCIKKITNAKLAILLNQQDQSIAQYAKCVYQNLITIVFGNFYFNFRIRQCVG